MFPDDWKGSSEDADYDLVDISLDQMLNAINAGDYEIAEQNRLSAYAFFEFGPEIKLRGFDPGLSTEIEGMFWYGARGFDGLATQIANKDSGREVQPTLIELKSAIEDAHEITGSNTSSGTVITNAALIVFREGLEAILIIAAITASMIGARKYLRKPVYRGALLAIPASVVSYVLMVMLLGSFAKYGEKVEAIVGLMAIGVLSDRAQLVLPQGLLDRVDRHPSPPHQGNHHRTRRRGGRRRRHRLRPLRARVRERVPRRHGDRALPPGPPAGRRHRTGADRRRRSA